MGWVAIPLAVLGLAALSNGNNTGTEYASYQECTYAPAGYGYQGAQSYSYAQPMQSYGQYTGYAQPAAYQNNMYTQQGQTSYVQQGYSSGYAGASYTGGGGY